MKTGQGFLLVFSITSPSSLNELEGLREEILRIKDEESVPMVIVGNKADLEEGRVIPRAKGFAVSQKWGAPYYEASARTRSKFGSAACQRALPNYLPYQTNLALPS
jgi:GTPase SAR1 family protein